MKKLVSIILIIFTQTLIISAQNEMGTFTDNRDGKVYKTVKIGSHWWFAENLSYKTENSWAYNNEKENEKIYGRLYTFKAATTACPAGWHLATEKEWTSLSSLIDEKITGTKLKTKTLWENSDLPGTNEFNFNALPGGYRTPEGIKWNANFPASLTTV